MTASNKDLKHKEQLDEVASGISVGCSDIEKLIYEYAFDASPKWLKKPFTLFGFSSLLTQISALISHAGPLDLVESYIRSTHKKIPDIFSRVFNIDGMQGTLCQLAIIGLDLNMKNGVLSDEGMAEFLMRLHAELSPATYPKALEQARLAAPLEDEKERTAREATNIAELNKVYDALKKNDANTDLAIEAFKEFVKKTKPEVMINNRYYLNLIHLLYGAFDVFIRKGGELEGDWGGALGDRFCYEIIGTVIQSAVSPRTKQIFEIGIYNLLEKNEKAPRMVDIGGVRFSGVSTKLVLGVNAFYDVFAPRPSFGLVPRYNGSVSLCFFKLYYQQCQHTEFITQRRTHSTTCCLIM